LFGNKDRRDKGKRGKEKELKIGENIHKGGKNKTNEKNKTSRYSLVKTLATSLVQIISKC